MYEQNCQMVDTIRLIRFIRVRLKRLKLPLYHQALMEHTPHPSPQTAPFHSPDISSYATVLSPGIPRFLIDSTKFILDFCGISLLLFAVIYFCFLR